MCACRRARVAPVNKWWARTVNKAPAAQRAPSLGLHTPNIASLHNSWSWLGVGGEVRADAQTCSARARGPGFVSGRTESSSVESARAALRCLLRGRMIPGWAFGSRVMRVGVFGAWSLWSDTLVETKRRPWLCRARLWSHRPVWAAAVPTETNNQWAVTPPHTHTPSWRVAELKVKSLFKAPQTRNILMTLMCDEQKHTSPLTRGALQIFVSFYFPTFSYKEIKITKMNTSYSGRCLFQLRLLNTCCKNIINTLGIVVQFHLNAFPQMFRSGWCPLTSRWKLKSPLNFKC